MCSFISCLLLNFNVEAVDGNKKYLETTGQINFEDLNIAVLNDENLLVDVSENKSIFKIFKIFKSKTDEEKLLDYIEKYPSEEKNIRWLKMKRKVFLIAVLILVCCISVCFAWDAFAFFNLKTVSIDEVKSTCIESSQQTVTDVQIKKTEEYPEYLFAICSVETYDGTKGDELFLFERAYYLDKYETERYKIKEFSQAISSSKEVGSLFCELKNTDNAEEKTLLYFSSNKNGISTATFSFAGGEKATKTVNESEAFLMFVPDSEEFAKEEVFEIEFFDSKGNLMYSEISKSGSPTGK